MTKLRILSAAAAAAAALLLAATALPAAAHGPGPGFGPGFAPRPPAHRPVWHRPPPPRHHSWHSRDWTWVWGPLADGLESNACALSAEDVLHPAGNGGTDFLRALSHRPVCAVNRLNAGQRHPRHPGSHRLFIGKGPGRSGNHQCRTRNRLRRGCAAPHFQKVS